MAVLNRSFKQYDIPVDLYVRLKNSLNEFKQDHDEINKFLDNLPHKLKVQTSVCIYKNTIQSIKFLKDQTKSFIAWVCPLLKTFKINDTDYVYFEGDDIDQIYFLKEGYCSFVLPKYNNTKYIDIDHG